MSGIEGLLAAEDRLDGRIEACRAELDSELDDIKKSVFGDVIDWSNADRGFEEKAVRAFAAVFNADSDYEGGAIVRASVFAMQTLHIMYGGKLTGLTLPDYMLSEDLGMEVTIIWRLSIQGLAIQI